MKSTQQKLEEILNRCWNTNFQLENYTEFLDYIDKTENNTKDLTEHTQYFTKWIETVLIKLERKQCFENKEIIKLILELMGILCKNEVKIVLLNYIDADNRIMNLLPKDYSQFECYKFSYVNMLISYTKTDIGLDCLSTTIRHMKNILYLSCINTSERFTKLCSILFSNMSIKISTLNKTFLINVTKIFMNPFYEFIEIIDKGLLIDDNVEINISKNLNPLLNLMIQIDLDFCTMVKNGPNLQYMLEFSRSTHIEEHLSKILKSIKTQDLTLKISKTLISIQFYEILALTDFLRNETNELAKNYIQNVIDILNLNIKRKFVQNVIQLCDLGIIFTKCMSIADNFKPLNFCDKPFIFETQLLFMQIFPVWSLTIKIIEYKITHVLESDIGRSTFVDNIFKNVHPMIVHTMYFLKELLHKRVNIEEDVQFSLKYILKSTDLYSKTSGVAVFQTLVYNMQDIVNWLKDNTGVDPNIFTSVVTIIFKLLVKLINKYDISWKDCVETIDLMDIILDLLKFNSLISKLVEKGLKVIEVCISKFMSPNLALLIDSNESGMNYLGAFLHSKLHDKNSQVKNATLEVWLTIIKHAKNKYPYFQKFLHEFRIPEKLFEIINVEEDCLSKNGALKCLDRLIVIEEIWNRYFCHLNIQEYLLKMIQTETNVYILSQTINILSTLYDQDHLSENQVTELYSNMCLFSVCEFNTPICLSVILFWEKVIKKMLHEEGMIDNVFPEVTFSKELRKIIVLDKPEIGRRLSKLFNRLSQIGCLNVLSEYLQNYFNQDIFENTLRISTYLINILKENDIKWEQLENHNFFITQYETDNLLLNYDLFDNTFLSVFSNNILSLNKYENVLPKDFIVNVNNVSDKNKSPKLNIKFDLLMDRILNSNL